MATLKPNPTLKDLQKYVNEVVKERGWDKNSPIEIFFLMMEEIGELAKAMREYEGLCVEKNKLSKRFDLEEEFADVFAYLLDLANRYEIDLESAFRRKEIINLEREWGKKDG